MNNAPAIIETSEGITLAQPPEVVLQAAQKAAKALSEVVSRKKKPVIFNGEQYLEFEDWQTVGRFYGVTAKVISTAYIEHGAAKGYEARAVALRADGAELSAAEAQCLSDEGNWQGKALFMLRSMAQTRACAKALRNVLSWIVVLAGYKGTPAEEMTELTKAPAAAPARPGVPTAREQLKRALEAWPEAERPGILKMASHFTNSKGEDRWISNLDEKVSEKWIFSTLARVKELAKKRSEDVPKEIE